MDKMNAELAPMLGTILDGLYAALLMAGIFALILLGKSVKDYTRTGPQLKKEVQAHYGFYLGYALGRLTFWAFLISFALACAGVLAYGLLAVMIGFPAGFVGFAAAAGIGLVGLAAFRFWHVMVWTPSIIAISSQYRMRRLVRLWNQLSLLSLDAAESAAVLAVITILCAATWVLAVGGQWLPLAALAAVVTAAALFLAWGFGWREPPARRRPNDAAGSRPNIVMIGSDTLRADRLGAESYRRDLTPFIDGLARRGALFSQCFVPCARTAPSLLSLFTGCWPHNHGVRDNFVAETETRLPVPALPQILREAGYATAAVGDWAAGDLKKFRLGFESCDVPADQWNLKYLLRQGPKDIRLFLSLFTRNHFGKVFVPELYYLAGSPLTRQVGRDARAELSRLAARDQPFLLNVFMASTHPPFGSDYPYYTIYADPEYVGESKFAMARLTDPFEIIRRQGDSRKEFDLDQIIDLYDGCVRSFDDEVARIVRHLEACGLADNTIVVIYSDHGMEFFEHETWGQGNSVVGDFSARVPLVIADPRAGRGREIGSVVRSIDVMPTLMELVGLSGGTDCDGTSLVPLIREGTEDLQLAAFSETGIWLTDMPGMPEDHLRYPALPDLLDVPDKARGTLAIKQEFRDVIIRAKDRMMRKGNWKLVYQPVASGARVSLAQIGDNERLGGDEPVDASKILVEMKRELDNWIGADQIR